MALNYGIKVSTPANEVLTQEDKDLAFTTKYSTIKILKAGDLSVTTDESGNGSTSYTHNFGFAPGYFAFRKATAQWTFLDASSYSNSYIPDPGIGNEWGGSVQFNMHIYTDSTKIYLDIAGASASTTYTVHYLLLLDLAEDYSGASSIFDKNIGFKVSKPGIDVLTAKPYELAFTSRCKSLQYFSESYKADTLTLPQMWTSVVDSEAEEGTYIDINHGLGYPPLFLAFFRTNYWFESGMGDGVYRTTTIPFSRYQTEGLNYQIGAFCDSTKVRISYYRKAYWVSGADTPGDYNSENTIGIKCYIFTEDLSQTYG